MFLIESLSLKNQVLSVMARNFIPTKNDPVLDVGFEILDHKNASLGTFGLRIDDLDKASRETLELLNNDFGVEFAFPDTIKQLNIATIHSEYQGDTQVSNDYTSKIRQILPGYRMVINNLVHR